MTELLLLKLLLASEETTVLSAVQNHQIPGLREAKADLSAGLTGPRPTETKKATLISHWDKYPLDTFEDVRRWKEDTLLRIEYPPTSLVHDSQRDIGLEGSSENDRSQPMGNDSAIIVGTEDQPHMVSGFGEEGSQIIEDDSSGIGWDENVPTSHLSRTPAETLAEEAGPLVPNNAQTTRFQSNPEFDLPEDFRKQFLW